MRDQVQRWLSACVVAGHDTPDGDNAHVAFEVDAPTLEALCRRWLAVDSAPVRNVVGQQWDDVFAREGNVIWCSDLHPGQRVRIVPEQGEGDRG